MRHSLSMLATRARKANTAVREYLGMLAMMMDSDEYDEADIRHTVEQAGRDWYSDKGIALGGIDILEGASVPAPEAFWAKAFHKAIRDAAKAYGIAPGEALDLVVAEYGDEVRPVDIRRWIPETAEDKPKRDRLAEAIALVMEAGISDPRVEAMVLDLMG